MISFCGHGSFKCTELECRECEKTIKIKDGIFMESTMRKSNLNTVIPGYGMYTIYQTEENPKKAISSIQSVLKNKLRKTQEEIEKINAILQKQQNNQTAIQERQNNIDELRDIIINAVCSENVYGEIVDKIIVYDDYMLVKLKYIDFAFKIKYSTHGYMEKYTTVIESYEIVSF